VPLPQIQAILGHANLATTSIYLHSLSDSQRAAAKRMQAALLDE
jgi:site-specific recombinase XerD